MLVDETLSSGRHKAVLDAGSLASGLYIVRIAGDGFEQAQQLTLLR